MYMILISINGMDKECGIFLDGLVEAGYQFGLNVIFKPLSAVLGAPDNVVLVFVGAMV